MHHLNGTGLSYVSVCQSIMAKGLQGQGTVQFTAPEVRQRWSVFLLYSIGFPKRSLHSETTLNVSGFCHAIRI